jgi:hypothetical protein
MMEWVWDVPPHSIYKYLIWEKTLISYGSSKFSFFLNSLYFMERKMKAGEVDLLRILDFFQCFLY